MGKYSVIFILLATQIFCNGCGTGDNLRARNAMETSKAAYQRCLEQNPSDPSKCESLKRVYEADLDAYLKASASKGSGPTVTGFIEF
jgi:hypothetical protein